MITYPIDGKVSLRVLLAVDSRLFEGELVKKWSKSRTEAPHPLPQPYAYGTQGYKGCYFFLACFSQFFSVVVFLFVHRDAKNGFLFFPIFSFPFFVDFLFACFL